MSEIFRNILKRILSTIPILIIVSFISFGLMNLASGDPAQILLSSQGTVVTQELLESTREKMGLNEPFIVQYITWLKSILKGNFGTSYATGRSVLTELSEHLPYTVALAGSAMILTLIISIPLGIIAAINKDKFIDHFIKSFTFIGNSIPGFLLALILLLVFSLNLKILPILSESGIKSIILPTVTLSFAMTSKYINQVRAAVIDEMEKGYVKGARSRGIKESVIIYKNVLKNILITVVTLTGLSIGSLMGGTAVVESIFVWPGLGNLVLTAISNRDYPIIQGYVLWMAVIFIAVNLITDLLYKVIDPRVREA